MIYLFGVTSLYLTLGVWFGVWVSHFAAMVNWFPLLLQPAWWLSQTLVYMVTTELRLCAMSQGRFTRLQQSFVCVRCHRAGLHGYNRASFVCDVTGPVYMVTKELRVRCHRPGFHGYNRASLVCDRTSPLTMELPGGVSAWTWCHPVLW